MIIQKNDLRELRLMADHASRLQSTCQAMIWNTHTQKNPQPKSAFSRILGQFLKEIL